MSDEKDKDLDNAHDENEDLSVPKPDMSGEVSDPVFDDNLPSSPPTDFIPDPNFDVEKTPAVDYSLDDVKPIDIDTDHDHSEDDTNTASIKAPEDGEHAQDQDVDVAASPTNHVTAEDNSDASATSAPSPSYDDDNIAPETMSDQVPLEDHQTNEGVTTTPDVDAAKENSNLLGGEPDPYLDDPAPVDGGYDAPDAFSEDLGLIETDVMKKGEDSLLSEKDPTLRKVYVGVGWDMNNYDGEPIDLDLSCFILNKENLTRVDTDFVFYNNLKGADLAVQHSGDNRTGIGEGDDETITLDLDAMPFEVAKIAFVVTIYMGEEEGHTFEKVKNAFIRIVNADTRAVLARFDLNTEFGDGTCLRFGELTREGGNWAFHATGEIETGGLSKIAQEYGILVAGT